MRALNRRSLLLVSFFAAAAAAQQPPTEAVSNDIIVEGNRNQEKRIAEFVNALTKATPRGQLSRFEQEICPMAAGVPNFQKEALVHRLRQVADAVGIPVAASAACQPNVLVIVTRDKQALMQRLEHKRPEYFPLKWSRGHIQSFVRDPAPVAAWHIEGQMRRDGRAMATDYGSGLDYQKTIEPASRMVPSARPHFLGAIMVVDVDALAGLTPIQLADYAAMRGFARTDPRALAASTTPTILHVIDTPMGSEVPVTMTEWDFSFLKALYHSDGRNYAAPQRTEMRKLVKQELNQAQGPEE